MAQSRKAAKALGSGIEFLHYDYEDLSVGKDRLSKLYSIVEIIRRMKPDVVFTHLLTDTSIRFHQNIYNLI
jgi:LmbE family N-acetylglucosaminyl deacetylase